MHITTGRPRRIQLANALEMPLKELVDFED